jgi:hypothetical protein
MTSQLKTIKVQGGKEYAEVHTRVNYFRSSEKYKDWGEDCEVISQSDSSILMKATIYNPEGRVVSSGHAYEEKDGSRINQRNHVENCETSAVGRALGFLGIGSDGSIASYEEVANAIENQKKDEVKETHIVLDIGDDNYSKVLKYIETQKDKRSFEDIIETLQTKYKTISKKVKTELKKSYEGK